MEDTDLAYLAGFFDGEGTIRLYPYGQPRKLRAYLKVTQVDRGVLDWASGALRAGNVYVTTKATERSRQCHSWIVTKASEVQNVLALMLPYLRLKAAQAEHVLAWTAAMKRRDPKRHDPKWLDTQPSLS